MNDARKADGSVQITEQEMENRLYIIKMRL